MARLPENFELNTSILADGDKPADWDLTDTQLAWAQAAAEQIRKLEEQCKKSQDIVDMNSANYQRMEAALAERCLQPDVCDSACKCCQLRWHKINT